MRLNQIFIEIQGGLGNQIFQYAFARSIQLKFGGQINLITKRIKNPINTKREFSLFKFYKIKQNAKLYIFPSLFTIFYYITAYKIYEKNPFFYQEIFFKKKNVWIKGYWQSYKYFEKIKDILNNEIFSDIQLLDPYKKFSKAILSTNSVALHVRRGDYISNPYANKHHGVLRLEYYIKAIKKMNSLEKNIHIFIFSDDLQWCKKNFNFKNQNLIYSKNIDFIQEIKLMLLCKHFIIANSSFSWWPAYLCDYQNKIIICPSNWINKQFSSKDLLMDEWIKIDSK